MNLLDKSTAKFGQASRGALVSAGLLGVLLLCLSQTGLAQEKPKFQVVGLTPGGIHPFPVITSISATQDITLEWTGVAGPYHVERCPGLDAPKWETVGSVTNAHRLTLPREGALGFFRVRGAAPLYAGAETCMECHSSSHTAWSASRHAGALETLKKIKQENNSRCLACHTVGYGTQYGFKDEATTAYLAGVQCENCHGPGAEHASNPRDLAKRPIVTLSSKMCGGCHRDFHHPTYDEWATSAHASVTPVTAIYFERYGEARIRSCGACHSGAARLALLKNEPLPSGADAAEVSVTCAVCHEAHGNTPHGRQLRNPAYSLQPFSYSTSTNTSFAIQYDAKLNLCGQCHNARGADWKDTSRPPHHSTQYNMLVGAGGIESGTAPEQSKHRDLQKQCTHCHTHHHPVENPSEENPVLTGHDFHPDLRSCTECHTEGAIEELIAKTQTGIKDRLAQVKALLDEWATTRSPEPLRANYGPLAWEYNNVGGLSNPSRDRSIRGPTSSEQTVVPDNIKQARFNLYLVSHDNSYGVHNAKYARYLIQVAEEKVKEELAKVTTASARSQASPGRSSR